MLLMRLSVCPPTSVSDLPGCGQHVTMIYRATVCECVGNEYLDQGFLYEFEVLFSKILEL